jgi:hypothetical protein
LKKYGDPATVDRAALSYGEAEAEYDGVIAGLVVALARREQPASLPDLQRRLQRGFDKREALCREARARLQITSGDRAIVEQIVSGAVKPVIEAVVQIYKERNNRAELARKAIQTELEATTWPAFAAL